MSTGLTLLSVSWGVLRRRHVASGWQGSKDAIKARRLLCSIVPASHTMAKDRSLEGTGMKKVSLIAGMASLATLAAVWSLPAAAAHEAHDKWPGQHEMTTNTNDNDADDNTRASSHPVSVPEPGALALLGLGLGGLGLYGFSRRKSAKA